MANPRIAIFPGSFDPPTLGHLDIIHRAAALFDTVIVAILENSSKQPYFSIPDRAALLRGIVAEMANVRVDSFHGLLADYAREQGASAVVRGVRGATDLEYERQMADTNRQLNPALDTVFFSPSPAVAHVSSTLVREIANLGGSVRGLVPPSVAVAIADRRQSGTPGHPGRTQQV